MVDCSDHKMYRIHELRDSRTSFGKTILHRIDVVGNKAGEAIKTNVLSNLGDRVLAVKLLYIYICLRCHLF